MQRRDLRAVVDDDIGIPGMLPRKVLVIGFGRVEAAMLDPRRDGRLVGMRRVEPGDKASREPFLRQWNE